MSKLLRLTAFDCAVRLFLRFYKFSIGRGIMQGLVLEVIGPALGVIKPTLEYVSRIIVPML